MNRVAFVSPSFAPWSHQPRCDPVAPIQPTITMRISTGKPSFYTGIGVLAAVLINRVFLTPLDNLALTQSRSDIIGVVAGATLVLYGVGKAEITDKRETVDIGGEEVQENIIGEEQVSNEVQWASSAIFKAIPSIQSFTFIKTGRGLFYSGRFRDEKVVISTSDDGIIQQAITSGERAYLADMKIVPVKETEFAFLPKNCQVRNQKIVLSNNAVDMT